MKMKWINGDIVYQIVPDRFHIGNNKDVNDKKELYPENAKLLNWDEIIYKRDRQTSETYYGGDLLGITEKLDYLKNLGVSILYFTPIFDAPSSHKYDILDYKSVDVSLGGEKAFEEFLAELHKRNMKFILDIALSHTSKKHPFFVDAISNENSKYIDYYCFTDYPNKYLCWQGHDRMPQLNFENEEVLKEFITGKNSVVSYWAKKGIDGIRLDCANDMGPELCSLTVKAAKKINPDIYIIGEVFNYSAKWLEVLDAVQSYFITESIFSVLNEKISTRQFGLNLQRLSDEAGDKLLNCFIILSSHDYARCLDSIENVKKYFLALVLQFTLPGLPIIYYGEELGMKGREDTLDPFNRDPMPWDKSKWNNEILNNYKKLIEIRKNQKEFSDGNFIDLSNWLDNGVIAYLRASSSDCTKFSLVLLNTTDVKKDFKLFVPYNYFFSDMYLKDILSNQSTKVKVSTVQIELQPLQAAIFVPDAECMENYSFFERL